MSYVVSVKTSKEKGRQVSKGGVQTATPTFEHRYIDAVNDDGEPTGNWNPESGAEAFAHYAELFPNEETQKADMLFLINRRFYFDDQPGADPIEKAARELAKKLNIDPSKVRDLLSGLRPSA